MPQPAADRNMLFGILAMQMDFITRDQLVSAMQTWVFDKNKSLGEILVAQKALGDDNRALLESVVQKNLDKHDNNVEKSLAAIIPEENLRRDLEQITDMDVQRSLGHMQAHTADPYATIAPTPSMVAAVKGTNLRFRIVRPHARGGLGEVFVALDEELHREVALKEIQDHQADNQESRTRFLLEAEITGGLEHPGIVPIYGLGAYEDGRPYYAMRFIRGDSLKEAIDRFHRASAKMSEGDRALELRGLLGRFVDVCNAIAYAHSRGILHRDIKPGNVMLGKYGETLVVDWGLAKPLDEPMKEMQSTEPGEGSLRPSSMSSASQTVVSAAVGTPQYMSPEQASGRLDLLGPASDVYSLGATLYCLLTGKTPISDTDVGTTLLRVQRGDFPGPRTVQSNVVPALDAICLKAMALKPADRYATARLLAEDIEHWLADEPVTAWKEPWTVTTRRWIGRHATLVTSVGSAVVVGLVGLILATVLLAAAEKREREAKQKAEENFKLAKEAVDTYHTKVSEDDLLQEPGMEPLRKKLLKEAERDYEKFVKDRENDPTMQGELGKAKFRLAQITGDIGSRPDAIKLHEQAVNLFETLPAGQAKVDFQADQAASYHHLGRLYRLTNQLAKSDEAYEKSLKEWQRLVDGNPKESRYQAGLARIQMQLGNQYQVAGDLAKAQPSYEKSLNAWNELLKTNQAATEYQREIGTNYSNLGIIYQRLVGKEKEAEKALRSAYAIRKKLAEDATNISKYQDDLATTSYLLARSLYLTADLPADAAPFLEEAAARWQTLVDKQPAVTNYQKRLAEVYMELAHFHRATYLSLAPTHPEKEKELKDAEAACQRALVIQRKLAEKNKDDEDYQGILATGLYSFARICSLADRSKDAESAFAEAIGIQEKLASKPTAPPHHRRDLAKFYSALGAFQENKNEEKAVAAYKNASGQWEKLATAHPAEEEYVRGLSDAYYQLGKTLSVRKPVEAEPWFSKAIECIDMKNTNLLANANVKLSLSNAFWRRAELRTQLARHNVALKDWDLAWEFAPSKNRTLMLLPYADAHAAGKYVEAVQYVDECVNFARRADENALKAKKKVTDGEVFYGFARVYALAAFAAKDQKDLSDKYVAQGIEMLGIARDRGFFETLNTVKRQEEFQSDADIQILRDHPAFKKLTSQLKLQ